MRSSAEISHFFVANILDTATTLYGYHVLDAVEQSPVGRVMSEHDGDISRYLILKTAVVALLIGLAALSKTQAMRSELKNGVRWDFVYSKGLTVGAIFVYTAVLLNTLTILKASG